MQTDRQADRQPVRAAKRRGRQVHRKTGRQ